MKTGLGGAACVAAGVAVLSSGMAWAEEDWRYSARVNAWFPDMSGATAFSGGPVEGDFELDIEDVIDSLEFGFLGSFEAGRGRWGLFTDVVYSSIGDKKENLYGRNAGRREELELKGALSVNLDVDTWIVNAAAYYRALESQSLTLDLFAGVRYIDVEQKLDWEVSSSANDNTLPGRSGWAKVQEEALDGIVGLRGRVGIGDGGKWVLPFYLDLGTGGVDFTWQAAAGLGYAFDWGNTALIWRHLDYDLESGAAIADLQLSGPAAVFEFNW